MHPHHAFLAIPETSLLALILGALCSPVAPAATDPPLRYCLSYQGGADSIRLARTIELGLAGDSGSARSTGFPLDSMHTPRLLAPVGRWHREDNGEVSIVFGADAWQYVYDVRISDRELRGRVRVRTDIHLESPISWQVTGRRCGAAATEPPRSANHG